MKKANPKPTHGGKRTGSGRKAKEKTTTIRVTLEEKEIIIKRRNAKK